MADVVDGLSKKMIRRHPHVFGNAPAAQSEEEGLARWEEIKAQEKEEKQRRAEKRAENN